MDALKDCTTCKRHQNMKSIDDVADECFPCVYHKSKLGYYPNWEPVSGGMLEVTEEELELYNNWQGGKIVYEKPMTDNVNSPKHYTTGGIETIDYIRAKLGDEGTAAYCMGNVIKYTSRWRDKNGLEDLKKAQWYLNYAIEILEK